MSLLGGVVRATLRAGYWTGDRALHRLEAMCSRGRVLNVGAGDHQFGERCDVRAELFPDYLCDFEAVAVGQVPMSFPLFDTVLMSDVLEHFRWDRAALGLAYKLLRPGGRIIVRSPSMHSWGQLSFSLRGKPMSENPGTKHVRDGYTACALKMRLCDAGFVKIRRASPFFSEELVMVGHKR